MIYSNCQSRNKAFTLAEVLVSIAIFAVGLISVAALFPAAAILQKRTMDSVESRIVRNNAMAMLTSINFDNEQLNSDLSAPSTQEKEGVYSMPHTAGYVYPMLNYMDNSSSNYLSLDDRSSPTCFTSIEQRDYLWVPFLKREDVSIVTDTTGTIIEEYFTAPRDWTCYVFILKRIPESTYNRQQTRIYPVYLDRTGKHPLRANEFGNARDASYSQNTPLIRVIRTAANISERKFEFDNDINNDGFADLIVRGDMFLDEFGNIHRVKDATDKDIIVVGDINNPLIPVNNEVYIWFVPRADPEDDSPLSDIMIVNDLVREGQN